MCGNDKIRFSGKPYRRGLARNLNHITRYLVEGKENLFKMWFGLYLLLDMNTQQKTKFSM